MMVDLVEQNGVGELEAYEVSKEMELMRLLMKEWVLKVVGSNCGMFVHHDASGVDFDGDECAAHQSSAANFGCTLLHVEGYQP